MNSPITVTKPDDEGGCTLSEGEISRLIDETAKDLLDGQELKAEMDIWVRRGRVIRSYVRVLQPAGKHHPPDPYVLLSEHPNIRWSSGQLRNFVDAVDLWELLGEGQPSLPMTFYAIVAGGKGSLAEKKALLLQAVERHLTTRELKSKMAAEGASDIEGANESEGNGASGEGSVTTPRGDWKKVDAYALKLKAEISALAMDDMASLDVVQHLKDVGAQIAKLVAKFEKHLPR